MTRKQIEMAESKLDIFNLTEDEERTYQELRCREMINSIMIYHNIKSPYNETTHEFDKYLNTYVSSLGAERVLELVREQQADFAKAEVQVGVYTDHEGCTYNSCKWNDDD